MTAAPDLTWKMRSEPIESANGIAFEWTFAGTDTGAWGPDTPATGKPFSFNGVTFMRVENGKIVNSSDYYDGLGFQKQLGWISRRPDDFAALSFTETFAQTKRRGGFFRRSVLSGVLLETGLSTTSTYGSRRGSHWPHCGLQRLNPRHRCLPT